MILLIVLVAIPLVEIAVMIKVGYWLGFWPSLAIVVATFAAGAMVVGRSGLSAALRLQEAFAKGEQPAVAMLEGALHVVAGVLLMTPGFIADGAGLALLVPPLRRRIALWGANRMIGGSWVHVDARGGGAGARDRGETDQPVPHGGQVIEGEFQRVDERTVDPDRRRPGSDRQ